jgi:hypothetical protein
MKKLYININDKQGGEWALGCYGTLKQWRDVAMSWAFQDDAYNTYNILKYYKIKNENLIKFINDNWDLEIVEFDTNKEDFSEYDFSLTYLGDIFLGD